jgi:hypothetical protein
MSAICTFFGHRDAPESIFLLYNNILSFLLRIIKLLNFILVDMVNLTVWLYTPSQNSNLFTPKFLVILFSLI